MGFSFLFPFSPLLRRNNYNLTVSYNCHLSTDIGWRLPFVFKLNFREFKLFVVSLFIADSVHQCIPKLLHYIHVILVSLSVALDSY